MLIKHPRNGEYAFGFITGKTLLSTSEGEFRLNSIYVPTNHIYVGDIFLLEDKDVIHTNLSVREGIGARPGGPGGFGGRCAAGAARRGLLGRGRCGGHCCGGAARLPASQPPLPLAPPAEIVVSVGMAVPSTLRQLQGR